MIALEDDWETRLQQTEVLFHELFELSEKEKEFVLAGQWEENGIDELNRWIAQRQEIMNRIDEIRIEDQLINQAVTDEVCSNTKRPIEVIQQYRENCQKIILQIQENDRISRTGLAQACKKTGNQITNTRNSKKASMAYKTMNSTNEAWFFDKRK